MAAQTQSCCSSFIKDNTLHVTNVDYFWTSLHLLLSFPTLLLKLRLTGKRQLKKSLLQRSGYKCARWLRTVLIWLLRDESRINLSILRKAQSIPIHSTHALKLCHVGHVVKGVWRIWTSVGICCTGCPRPGEGKYDKLYRWNEWMQIICIIEYAVFGDKTSRHFDFPLHLQEMVRSVVIICSLPACGSLWSPFFLLQSGRALKIKLDFHFVGRKRYQEMWLHISIWLSCKSHCAPLEKAFSERLSYRFVRPCEIACILKSGFSFEKRHDDNFQIMIWSHPAPLNTTDVASIKARDCFSYVFYGHNSYCLKNCNIGNNTCPTVFLWIRFLISWT